MDKRLKHGTHTVVTAREPPGRIALCPYELCRL